MLVVIRSHIRKEKNMRRLLDLLLVLGMVGCGDPVEKLGGKILRDQQGVAVGVSFFSTKIPVTNEALVQVAGMTNLQVLDLRNTPITDAGLVHL
ncbi:MAG: hypothetical protein CMJ81_10440, partial [Planctomycetaceae bacterium]|nr:hypothetical protein [Planctomycetaceae bacterium]